MKRIRREQNPLNNYDRSEGIEHDKALVSPGWGSKQGNERGYNKIFGPYGSAARGWVDRPHDRNADRQDKISREKFVTEEAPEEEEYAGEQAAPMVSYEGRGPKRGRSDQWLQEEISELLMKDPHIDASEMEIEVQDGEVTISGSVPERLMKYRTEDLIEEVRGVKNLNIKLKVINSNQSQMN